MSEAGAAHQITRPPLVLGHFLQGFGHGAHPFPEARQVLGEDLQNADGLLDVFLGRRHRQLPVSPFQLRNPRRWEARPACGRP